MMKTCNGCEYLDCEKDDLIRDDNDNTVFCECKCPCKAYPKPPNDYIGWFVEGEPIPTPDWCPLPDMDDILHNYYNSASQKEVNNENPTQ